MSGMELLCTRKLDMSTHVRVRVQVSAESPSQKYSKMFRETRHASQKYDDVGDAETFPRKYVSCLIRTKVVFC